MDNKKLTVKELAQMLGVSISTVSKALNDSYEISDKTKKRIRKFAEKHNYRPNRLAVNLKSGTTRNIGVIIPSVLSNFFTSVLYGIEKVTNEENYNIITCFSNESHEKEVTITEILSTGSIDGLIVALAEETQINRNFGHLQKCIDNGSPVVMFDRITRAIDCDKVVVDDRQDAYDATRYLLEKGKKRLGLVSSIDFLSVGKNRVKGFLEALEGQTETPVLIRTTLDKVEKGIKKALIEEKVDGFLAADEDSALAIFRQAKSLGLEIPQQLSVIGYAGEKIARNLTPSLTTVNQNGVGIGEAAARIMIARLKDPELDFQTEIIETKIEQRTS